MANSAGVTSRSQQNGVIGGGKDGKFRFTVLADGVVRMEWAPDSIFEDRPSAFAAQRKNVRIPDFTIHDSEEKLEIVTSRFHLVYNKQTFSAYGLYALVFGFTRSLWRYKEPGQPNLGGTFRTLDNVDGNINREDGQPILIEPGILSQKGYALLDDSKSMLFTEDGFVAPRRPGEERVDCYLFAYGHDYRDAIKAFYSISGPTPLLPRWTLGNWWSRYYTYTADSYLALMDKFKDEQIPLSVSVLDMDWHLVDDPRIINSGQTGWTGYTWNRKLFPDPPAFVEQLHNRNLKVTLNDHPADGIHFYEDVYPEVAKFLGHDTSKNEPIEFDCVSRKYLKAYFDIVLRPLEKDGVDFWWMDWQQGPFSRLPGIDPLWVLNHFHYLHNKQISPKTNPLIFSRYASPGSHRYPIGFSGDTYTTWASLDFQPEFTAMASNIGYGWWSHDIGGHMLGVKDDELTIRWIQFGVFSPIMRLHSTKNRWIIKEPWRFPHDTSNIIKDFLRLRHRLIPYLQSMNFRAAFEGEPLIQPMYWEYPKLEEAYQFKNQYLFGSEMLVMPITTPNDHGLKMGKVKAWLPEGQYVDFFTGATYQGGRTLWMNRDLAHYPVFLKAGGILPLDLAVVPGNGGLRPGGIELVIAPGADGHFELREEPDDDRDQSNPDLWSTTSIVYKHDTKTLSITESLAARKFREWNVLFLGVTIPDLVECKFGSLRSASVRPQQVKNGALISLGQIHRSFYIKIELQHVPSIRKMSPARMIEPVLSDAQIEYDVKDKVWALFENEKADNLALLEGIQTLDISENLRCYLGEVLSLAQT